MPRREKWLKVYLFFVFLFVSFRSCSCWSIVRIVKLSYELELTRMGLRWMIYLHLSLSQRFFDRSMPIKYCRCFSTKTKGADGAADLLEALSHSTQLEELVFRECSQIPAAAWQKVRCAKWLNLKKADFEQCLAERNVGGFSRLLRVLICLCWMLSEFRFV